MAFIATIFCLWMAYAGGLLNLVMTSVFYLAGIGFFIKARKEQNQKSAPLFTTTEKYFLGILVVASLATIILLLNGFA